MSKRVDAVYLQDMLAYATRVRQRMSSVSREQFRDDQPLQESVSYLLAVIGEAANQLTTQARAQASIEWKEITAVRNRLIHGYWTVDAEKVFDIATEDIPRLITVLEGLLSR